VLVAQQVQVYMHTPDHHVCLYQLVVCTGPSYLLQGAAEWVLRQCNTFYNEYGDVVELTEEARNVMQVGVSV
jgi:hypothetical protein